MEVLQVFLTEVVAKLVLLFIWYIAEVELFNQGLPSMFAGQFKIIIFMNAPEKKTRACPFSSATPRWKKTTKSFCKEWASKLAESDKGSLYNQGKWLKEDKAFGKPTETTMESVAFFLRPKKNKLAPATQPASLLTEEMWQRLNGRATVAVDLLQVNLMGSWWEEQAF